MRAYAVNGPNATGTANKTAVTIIASATSRPEVYDIGGGTDGVAPTDVQVLYLVGRFTAAGTAGSAPVPEPLDFTDVASVATAGITHSAEPTYTAGKSLWRFSGNLRSPFRWMAYGDGYGFKAPATAANGIGVYLSTTQASTSVIGSFVTLFRE